MADLQNRSDDENRKDEWPDERIFTFGCALPWAASAIVVPFLIAASWGGGFVVAFLLYGIPSIAILFLVARFCFGLGRDEK